MRELSEAVASVVAAPTFAGMTLSRQANGMWLGTVRWTSGDMSTARAVDPVVALCAAIDTPPVRSAPPEPEPGNIFD